MKIDYISLIKGITLSCVLIIITFQFSYSQTLEEIIDSKHRSKENKARDQYRHPLETLKFFGIKNTMTVVEIYPGGGWYQEILAPFLKNKGQYISATFDEGSDNERTRERYQNEEKKLTSNKDLYGNVIMVPMTGSVYGDEESADMVLTFRNYHNWIGNSEFEKLRSIYKTLKPGGILGVTDHRSNSIIDEKGYSCEPCMIKDAEAVGFVYVASSQINANPKDTKDYPIGVWNLLPTLSEEGLDKKTIKSKQRQLKLIGESDRYTLKFIKPINVIN